MGGSKEGAEKHGEGSGGLRERGKRRESKKFVAKTMKDDYLLDGPQTLQLIGVRKLPSEICMHYAMH